MLYFFLALFLSLSAGNKPTTPIRHLIVIYQENRTFDHYFGTYPTAQNNPGETPFYPAADTPTVNGFSDALLNENPNGSQPFRYAPSEANTCDPDHNYAPLQSALNRGLMDAFPTYSGCKNSSHVMGYFDGNTVTALWNYAQSFALNDNCHTTVIGASTIGAVNLVSGQTHGTTPTDWKDLVMQGTIINDLDPAYDMCSAGQRAALSGINVGNLLNKAGVTWGWFQGGFADCSSTHEGPTGAVVDYEAHHNPFQYYESTSNMNHLPPSSLSLVGYTDRANHLYDLSVFWKAADRGNIPSVCFFKPPAYQNGHPANSNPLLEQNFLTATINKLQTYPQWENMAIIILYDDSGGWYDHEVPPLFNQSNIPSVDTFAKGPDTPLGGYMGRPAYGLRIPCLVISPWAKQNYVDHNLIDQTSVLQFIEDNWSLETIGDFSFDTYAGSIFPMFDFSRRNLRSLFLNPNNGSRIKR